MKSKHIIATIAVVLTGWLASSQINGVQAKYEQDVADYQAVVAGDTLPLQARMEKASPRQSVIDLSNAIQHFRNQNHQDHFVRCDSVRLDSYMLY